MVLHRSRPAPSPPWMPRTCTAGLLRELKWMRARTMQAQTEREYDEVSIDVYPMLSKDPTVTLSPPQPIAELLHVVTMPIADPFGAVMSAHATVNGHLCQATLRLHDIKYVLLVGDVELYESDDSFDVISDTHYDTLRKTALHTPLYLLLIASREIKTRRWEFSDELLDLDGKTYAGLSLVQPRATPTRGRFLPMSCSCSSRLPRTFLPHWAD